MDHLRPPSRNYNHQLFRLSNYKYPAVVLFYYNSALTNRWHPDQKVLKNSPSWLIIECSKKVIMKTVFQKLKTLLFYTMHNSTFKNEWEQSFVFKIYIETHERVWVCMRVSDENQYQKINMYWCILLPPHSDNWFQTKNRWMSI